MKAYILLLMGLCAAASMSGCETEIAPDARTQASPGTKLQRGLTGRGAIVQPTREDDPFVQGDNRVGQ